MAESADIKQKFTQAVLISLLKNWNKVDPAAGEDPAQWNQADIQAFAGRYADNMSDDALRQWAMKQGDELRADFEKKVFFDDASAKLQLFRLNDLEVPAAEVPQRDGPDSGLSRGAGSFQAEQASAAEQSKPAAPTTPELVLEPAPPPSGGEAPIVPASSQTASGNASISTEQLPPQPSPGLAHTDDFTSTAAPGTESSETVKQPRVIPPTDWSAIRHILRTNDDDMARIDAAHAQGEAALGKPHTIRQNIAAAFPLKALENAVPFTAASSAYLAVRYPGYDHDPLFLEALDALARNKEMTIEELLASPRVQLPGKMEEIETPEAVHQLYQATALLHAPPFAGFERKITHYGIMTKPWYTNLSEWMGGGVESPNNLSPQHKYAGVMFVDAAKNVYLDTGKNVSVTLGPGENTMKPEHFFNMTRIFMSGRFDPSGKIPQDMQFDLDGGHPMSRLMRGGKGADGKNLTGMILTTLAECERLNGNSGIERINKKIRIKKMSGWVPLNRILTEADIRAGAQPGPNDFVLNQKMCEEMTMYNINIGALIRKFNDGPASAPETGQPTISSPDPVISNALQNNPAANGSNGTNGRHHSFPDLKTLTAAGIGKLAEIAMEADLTSQLDRAADLQAEMMIMDRMLAGRNEPESFRKQFLEQYNQDPVRGHEILKNMFTPEDVASDLAGSTTFRQHIDGMNGLNANEATPAFGAILKEVLVRGDNGAHPMTRDVVEKYLETASLMQFSARMIESLATGNANFAYPRKNPADTSVTALAGDNLTRLKTQLDQKTLDEQFAGNLVQNIIPNLVRRAQQNLHDLGEGHRVSELGTLFSGPLNDIADRFGNASRKEKARQPSEPPPP